MVGQQCMMAARQVRLVRDGTGFGLSLVYRGLDRYPQPETGIFVARLTGGGAGERAGLREGDRVLRVAGQQPATVERAVRLIKDGGPAVDLLVVPGGVTRGAVAAGPGWQSGLPPAPPQPHSPRDGRFSPGASSHISAKSAKVGFSKYMT